MQCTIRRWIFAVAAGCAVFTLCLLRGRGSPSPRLLRQVRYATEKVLREDAKDELPVDQAVLSSEALQRLKTVAKPSAREAANQLLAAALRHNHTLSVVQVGACDGAWADTNDPVQPLLTNVQVRGLLLEPAPPLWEELNQRIMALPRAEGRLLALNAALCPAGGATSLPFYTVSSRYAVDNPAAPHWAKKEIGSLLRSHVLKHRIPPEYIEEIPVSCRTTNQIFQEAGAPVKKPQNLDVLLVDAEGMDAEVVNAFFDLPGFRPAMVVFERQHMPAAKRKQLADRLRLRHYHLWDEDSRNSVAFLEVA